MSAAKKLLFKSMTYRAVSIATSVGVAGAVTGSASIGLTVGLLDSVFMMAVFVVNEILWERVGGTTA